METKIIRGDPVRDRILAEVKAEVEQLKEEYHGEPGIAFIGFGGVPLAKYNVPMHIQLATAAGLRVTSRIMDVDAGEEDLLEIIRAWNADDSIHAIVLLQPLPPHLNPVRIVNCISPVKEVEGFHPQNMMATMIPDIGAGRYPMCLPEALTEMFRDAGVQPGHDREWVFLLDEAFTGNTLTKMIVRAAASRVVPDDSTVTYVNRDSENMVAHCKRADVLVVVTKFPEYVSPGWLKPGVCIIDIYSNLVREVPSKTDPMRLVPVIRGGVNPDSVNGIAGAILPIPGGLMTVVMAILFRNTVIAFRNSAGSQARGNIKW